MKIPLKSNSLAIASLFLFGVIISSSYVENILFSEILNIIFMIYYARKSENQHKIYPDFQEIALYYPNA